MTSSQNEPTESWDDILDDTDTPDIEVRCRVDGEEKWVPFDELVSLHGLIISRRRERINQAWNHRNTDPDE